MSVRHVRGSRVGVITVIGVGHLRGNGVGVVTKK